MTTTSDRPAVASALCSDGRRALIATAVGIVVPVVAGLVLGAVAPYRHGSAVTLVLALAGWNLFVVVYVALTLRTFAGTDRDAFERKMARRRESRSFVLRRLTPGATGRPSPSRRRWWRSGSCSCSRTSTRSTWTTWC